MSLLDPSAPRPGTRRWYDRWSRYLALITVVLTFVTTTVVFFAASDEHQGLKELVTAGLGLLGLVIALQIEILFRVSERTRTRDQYSRVLQGIEDYPDLLPLTTEALEAATRTLKRTGVPQFRREVFSSLEHAKARLQELAQGRLRTEGMNNTLVLEQFKNATSLIQGTTDEWDTNWWKTDDGERFLRLNAELIANHGVVVERIWFLDRPPEGDVLALLAEHHGVGVKVFVVRTDREDIDRRLLTNLTILDGAFLQENINNRRGRAVEYLYSENGADLDRAKHAFAQLKSRATEFVALGSSDD